MLRAAIGVSALLISQAAAAQPFAPPTEPKGAALMAHLTFCMPLLARGTEADAESLARQLGYVRTELPLYAGLKQRTAPAWRVPTDGADIAVSVGGIGSRASASCEVTVIGAPAGPLYDAMIEGVPGAGFKPNPGLTGRAGAVRYAKYDLARGDSMVSLMIVADERDAAKPVFFVSSYRVP